MIMRTALFCAAMAAATAASAQTAHRYWRISFDAVHCDLGTWGCSGVERCRGDHKLVTPVRTGASGDDGDTVVVGEELVQPGHLSAPAAKRHIQGGGTVSRRRDGFLRFFPQLGPIASV
jgi:hypothetical protein